MNFKPTLLKTIISLLVALPVSNFVHRIYTCGGAPCPEKQIIPAIIAFIITFGIAYVAISFLQKIKRTLTP